jgi:hypothetical protein
MALLPEDRDAAIIVRKGALSQSILGFEQIKQLAERWEQAEHSSRRTSFGGFTGR